MKAISVCFLFFLGFTAPVCAMSADTVSPVKPDLPSGLYGFTDAQYEKNKSTASTPLDQTNPLKLFLVLLIRTYQVVFSAQDGSTCQFRPSCSHFGADAIKKHGPLQGFLMTGDRLLRCNPYTEGKYATAKDQFHNQDPTEDHTLWGK